MSVKQTAGRSQLGDFAPKFAELNDDVLFGEVWSREDALSLRDRSLVTVVALMRRNAIRQPEHDSCGIGAVVNIDGRKDHDTWLPGPDSIMAKLGLRTVDEMVGRTDLLRVLPHQITERAAMVDVSQILRSYDCAERRFDPARTYSFALEKTADERVLMEIAAPVR